MKIIPLLVVVTAVLAASVAQAQVVPQPKIGDPLPGLTPAQTTLFFEGRLLFDTIFQASEGLGPIFNDDSCGGCHSSPVLGGSGNQIVTRFGFQNKGEPFDDLGGQGGSLLQANAIDDACQETIPVNATIVANRVTPLAIGIGLIEEIPDADIVANEALSDGVVHWVPLLEDLNAPLRPGRFGWKAQLATVLSFTGDATVMEIGLTNPILMDENAPNGDMALLASCDTVPEPEVGLDFVEKVTAFQRLSSPPPQTPKSGMSGEQVFIDVGCADCHLATPYTTGTATEAALSNVQFKPYSDFLLHDMGSLGDFIAQGDASGTEFRTPPLWGIRFRDPILHDGRVAAGTLESRIDEAVAFHGGEGAASAVAYAALSDEDHDKIIAFLDSLGRAEFDSNGDTVISEIDFRNFRDCFTGPGNFLTADDPCAIHDIDQDGDVDLGDFESLLLVYAGPLNDCDNSGDLDLREILLGASDCNDNLVPDSCDIDDGTLADVNGNGVADSCELFIRADCNVDGDVNIGDPISQLNSFSGSPLACERACDSNADGGVDIADAVYTLNFLFVSGPAPAAPFGACGTETGGSLTCDVVNSNCP